MLSTALAIDALTVIAAILLLSRRGDLSIYHPAVIYMGFHVFFVSLRAAAVLLVEPPTFFNTTSEEFARALLFSDLLLISLTLGWVSAPTQSERSKPQLSEVKGSPLSGPYVILVSTVCVPLGVASLVLYGYVPGIESQASSVTTSYQIFAIVWPAICMCAAIYRWGPRWFLVAPLAGYLGLMALQGYGRYRLILPAVLFLLIVLRRAGRRWPPFWMVAVGVVLIAVFLPLKAIGQSVQTGQFSASVASSVIAQSFNEALTGSNTEQGILDQAAVTITGTDAADVRLYGTPYLSIFTLPVPRSLWPDKPGLNEGVVSISTPTRPLATVGGVPSLVGDLYLNFGIAGLTVGAFCFARLSGRLHRHAMNRGFGTVQDLLYLSVAAVLIQVYRDGVLSLFSFMLLSMTPLLLLAVLHYRGLEPARANRTRKRERLAKAH